MSSFRVYPLLNTKKSIPEGQALIFNTTPFDIGAQFGTEPAFEMKPNKRFLLTCSLKTTFFRYQFWVRKGNEWKKPTPLKKLSSPTVDLFT